MKFKYRLMNLKTKEIVEIISQDFKNKEEFFKRLNLWNINDDVRFKYWVVDWEPITEIEHTQANCQLLATFLVGSMDNSEVRSELKRIYEGKYSNDKALFLSDWNRLE